MRDDIDADGECDAMTTRQQNVGSEDVIPKRAARCEGQRECRCLCVYVGQRGGKGRLLQIAPWIVTRRSFSSYARDRIGKACLQLRFVVLPGVPPQVAPPEAPFDDAAE